MKIAIVLAAVFILSFIFTFKLVYSGNKTASNDEKLSIFGVCFIVTLLALLPTATIAFIIFVLLGSTNVVNMLFSLQIGVNEIIIFVIGLLVYLFSLDSLIELIVKQIVGKNMFYFILLFLIRTLASYAIGLLIDLDQTNSFIIGAGVAFMIGLVEVLYYMREKEKGKNVYK